MLALLVCGGDLWKEKQCSKLQTFLVSIQIDVACLEQTSSLPHYSTHREMITI